MDHSSSFYFNSLLTCKKYDRKGWLPMTHQVRNFDRLMKKWANKMTYQLAIFFVNFYILKVHFQ